MEARAGGSRGGLRGLCSPGLAARLADAHKGRTGVVHDRAHVGEVQVYETGHRNEVGDALHTLPQDVVGHPEGVHHAGPLLGDLQEPVVGDDDEGVDVLLEALDALLGVRRTPAALEGERPRYDPDGQRPRVPGYLGDHRGGARAGPAALARGDEDHVGAAHRLFDLRLVLLRGLHPDLRVRAGAEAARDLLPMWIFWSASHIWRAWASAFIAMNSTPCRPELIMRFTALVPLRQCRQLL